MSAGNVQVGPTIPLTTRQKFRKSLTDFNVKKMLLVIGALVILVGGPVIYFTSFDTDHLAWAGIIIATIGKLSELVGKSKEVTGNANAKDGFELFGIGASFFGLLMLLGAAIFGFNF